jgi:hypothetical protein
MTRYVEGRNLMAKFVTMEHPTLPGQTGSTTEEAFKLVWKPRGWRLVKSKKPTRKETGK